MNFRQIREILHFEITVDHLKQEGVLGMEENPEESRIQRGRLVKKSIRKRSWGCESLLRCLNFQLKEHYEKILRDWEKKKGYGKYFKSSKRKRERKKCKKLIDKVYWDLSFSHLR